MIHWNNKRLIILQIMLTFVDSIIYYFAIQKKKKNLWATELPHLLKGTRDEQIFTT